MESNMMILWSWCLLLSALVLTSVTSTMHATHDQGFTDEDVASEENLRSLYEDWAAKHRAKPLDKIKHEKRFHVFKDNVLFIHSSNKANNQFQLELNKFADLTNREFRAKYLGLKYSNSSLSKSTGEKKPFKYSQDDELPSSIDWRQKGVVAPVKYQGQCGSCWSFSTVAAVESLNAIATGNLVQLSEQQLLDCDPNGHGCNGGFMDNAFSYIIRNGGLTSEDAYPYQGQQQTCPSQITPVVQISNYQDVPENDEAALKQAVAQQPVSVAIDAGSSEFQFYQQGVFNGDCGNNLNHGVAIVGYDSSEEGGDYWIVKNSWGTNWGDKGYIKMQRNVQDSSGLCGIAMQASYPTN